MKKFLAVLVLLVTCMAVIPVCAESVTKMPWTISLDPGIRTGEYTGEVVNGVPHGYGLFSSENSDGVPWHYIGEWSNGIMHGDGLMVWETGYQENGTFKNGVFVSGTTVDEIVFPNLDIIDLPYAVAGEQVAKEHLTDNMVFVKTTHAYNYVNIYINIDKYADKKAAIHDACIYIIDVMQALSIHPDVSYVQCYFEFTTPSNTVKRVLSMTWRKIDALQMDMNAMRDLVDQSALSFLKQLYKYSVSYDYRDYIY